jgi:murein DD-endopeptidase MepM/ murein hydrolase activator NlpD
VTIAAASLLGVLLPLLLPAPLAATPLAATPVAATPVAVVPGAAPRWPAAASDTGTAPTTGFGWPLGPAHPVLRRFDPPETRYGRGHRGVDLGGVPGQPVLAAGDGVVLYAGMLADRPVISVEHSSGLRTTYEPVEPAVVAGQRVRRGEVIGHLLAGHAGCGQFAVPPTTDPVPRAGVLPATGPTTACLHWGLRRGDEYLDPLRLVLATHVRLLPWREGSR